MIIEDTSHGQRRSRISIPEIATRLSIGRIAVYRMLDQGIIPAIRVGKRWIVSRFAYSDWEHKIGTAKTASI